MDFVLAAIILGLLVDRYLLIRRHARDRGLQDDLNTKVINFAESTASRMAIQAEESRAQVSEMATRIQHPELLRPDIGTTDYTPAPPVYQDEFELVGKILPEPEQNGGVDGQ